MEWRLFSPTAKPLTCEILDTPVGCALRVVRDGAILFTAHAPGPEPLRARAAAWRENLERSGYSLRPPAGSPSGGPPSEIRSALVGVIECATVLELHDRGAARALRNQATSGLAAAALGDAAGLAAVVASLRATLSEVDLPSPPIRDLVASCQSLIDRIEAASSPAAPLMHQKGVP